MKKKLMVTTLLALVLICLSTGGVFANYQSSPNVEPVLMGSSNYMWATRLMEYEGYVMGLNETQAGGLLATTASNNIDVHAQKITEYDAMLIFAISDFGKQGNGTEGSNYLHTSDYGLATSTGNESGIFGLGTNLEFVAGTRASVDTSTMFSSCDPRYWKDMDDQHNLFGTYLSLINHLSRYQGGSAGTLTTDNFLYLRGQNSAFDGVPSATNATAAIRAVITCGVGF